jgi:hypothetical protein
MGMLLLDCLRQIIAPPYAKVCSKRKGEKQTVAHPPAACESASAFHSGSCLPRRIGFRRIRGNGDTPGGEEVGEGEGTMGRSSGEGRSRRRAQLCGWLSPWSACREQWMRSSSDLICPCFAPPPPPSRLATAYTPPLLAFSSSAVDLPWEKGRSPQDHGGGEGDAGRSSRRPRGIGGGSTGLEYAEL